MNNIENWLSDPSDLGRKSAAQKLFEELRTVIESGQFPSGSRLPSEAQLTQKYAVSRPIVREALHSLQVLGLTRTQSGRGTFVLPPREEEPSFGGYSLSDLMEARPHIEVPAAALAAHRRTDGDMAKLTALVKRLDTEQDLVKWVSLDGDLHCMIADMSRNAIFRKIVNDVRDALKLQSSWLGLHEPRRIESNEEHRRIVDAIASGDASAARNAMQDHLSIVAEALTRHAKASRS